MDSWESFVVNDIERNIVQVVVMREKRGGTAGRTARGGTQILWDEGKEAGSEVTAIWMVLR